jgi:hypothetical protein
MERFTVQLDDKTYAKLLKASSDEDRPKAVQARRYIKMGVEGSFALVGDVEISIDEMGEKLFGEEGWANLVSCAEACGMSVPDTVADLVEGEMKHKGLVE